MATPLTWAAKDVNNVSTLTAVSNVDGVTIVRLFANPTTGALFVNNLGASSSSGSNVNVFTGTQQTLEANHYGASPSEVRG